MEYAYLGEMTPSEFSAIRKAFPAIVGIEVTENDDTGTLVVCGVSKEMSNQAVGMYQLIFQLWDNDDAISHAWSGVM